MARFNKTTKTQVAETTNQAGGQAFSLSNKRKLVDILLTSLISDQYYRSTPALLQEVNTLVEELDPMFVAKAAVYARNVHGLRSITHYVAALLSKKLSGQPFAASFYDNVVRRPDDMLEIASVFKQLKNEEKLRLTNGMKKGFASAFNKFDNYQIAKYKADTKDISLVDIVNLVHPKSTDKNQEALSKLVAGTLKNEDTWEAKLSAAGSNEEEKENAWLELLREKRLGYLALLRNLRNILQTENTELIKLAQEALVVEKAIINSRVFPFQILTSFIEVNKLTNKGVRPIKAALEKAVKISARNLPNYDMDTRVAVAIDMSGSMNSQFGSTSLMYVQVGMFMAMTISDLCDNVYTYAFATGCKTINPPQGAILENTISFINNDDIGYGTEGYKVIQDLIKSKKVVDKILIFSDCQLYGGSTETAWKTYLKDVNPNAKMYVFDLAGYGTSFVKLNGNSAYQISGFSDKVFEYFEKMEQDPNFIINEIESVQL